MTRAPRPQTPKRLERAALAHLRRFTASSVELRRVLERRLRRAEARGEEIDRDALGAAINDIITRFTARGLLNDDLLAKGLARSYRRRGLAERAIRHKLRQKGIEPDAIDAALAHADEETQLEPDLEAAWRLARRRRLGPYRRSDRAERRERDLAALGRAGFSYGIARTVIDADALPDLD